VADGRYLESVSDDLTPDELAFVQSAFEHARSGDLARLVEVLDVGVPVNLTNAVGDTLLILAAYHVHAEVVRELIQRGADHGRINDKGQTALAAAVFRQDRDIVDALLEAGADPDHGPKSAVAIATFFELPQMLALLRR
jgi:ankyrin repeat protein